MCKCSPYSLMRICVVCEKSRSKDKMISCEFKGKDGYICETCLLNDKAKVSRGNTDQKKNEKFFTDGDIIDFTRIVCPGTKEAMDHAFDSIKLFLVFHSMHSECFIHKKQE